jgi:putative transcriptional regulator
MLTEHNENGSMGFIINKPLILRLNDIFQDIPLNMQLWNGGPVEPANMYYIHNVPNLLPESVLFNKEKKLYIGGRFTLVKDLLKSGKINEQNIKFFLGYSGWSAGQLDKEIKEKAWFITDNNIDLFHLNPINLWKDKIIEIDPKNIIWKNAPLNPHLN